MNFAAILVGFATFLIIGVFHPIVIKAEYYFSKKIWPIFLIAGIAFLIAALYCTNNTGATLLAILGFTCLWSIKELYEQAKRVQKGWFPANHKRKY